MIWQALGGIATLLTIMTIVIPWLVKIFIGPTIDAKMHTLANKFDSRFKRIEERLDDHIDAHGRYRR